MRVLENRVRDLEEVRRGVREEEEWIGVEEEEEEEGVWEVEEEEVEEGVEESKMKSFSLVFWLLSQKLYSFDSSDVNLPTLYQDDLSAVSYQVSRK